MKTVLLVSSDPRNTLPEQEFDLYVHFNGSIHFDKTPADKSMIITRSRQSCARKDGLHCHQACPNSCYLNIGKCNSECKISGNPEVLLVVKQSSSVKITDKIKILDPSTLQSLKYPDDFSPTTGFVAIHYFLEKGYRVSLLGFDLRFLGKTSGVHDFRYEAEQVDKMIFDKKVFGV
jgi:hypothetical protein